MKFYLFAILIIIASVSAIPFEQYENENDAQSKSHTWEAIKTFFQPMVDWFRSDLPKKTPTDLVDDVSSSVSETVNDIKDWSDESKIVQSAKDAMKPVYQWIKDTSDTLKDKSFQDMFKDTKEVIADVDEKVGTWIGSKAQTPELH